MLPLCYAAALAIVRAKFPLQAFVGLAFLFWASAIKMYVVWVVLLLELELQLYLLLLCSLSQYVGILLQRFLRQDGSAEVLKSIQTQLLV